MKIHFYPESDLEDYTQAVAFFNSFWNKEGNAIISKWQEITKLNFYEKEINAVVGNFKSQSHPFSLRFDTDADIKKATLVHELGHRILHKRVKGMRQKTSLERHMFLDLVLFDVLTELYGEEFTTKVIAWDSHLRKESGSSLYEEAWNWTLQFKDKESRQKVFFEILEGKIDL